jgi:hypothetical protein
MVMRVAAGTTRETNGQPLNDRELLEGSAPDVPAHIPAAMSGNIQYDNIHIVA